MEPKIVNNNCSGVIRTDDLFIDRLREEFGWEDDGEEGYYNSCLEAIVYFAEQGFVEASPIFEKYRDLFCEYCHELHIVSTCPRK